MLMPLWQTKFSANILNRESATKQWLHASVFSLSPLMLTYAHACCNTCCMPVNCFMFKLFAAHLQQQPLMLMLPHESLPNEAAAGASAEISRQSDGKERREKRGRKHQ
jgi:hypothetical protein